MKKKNKKPPINLIINGNLIGIAGKVNLKAINDSKTVKINRFSIDKIILFFLILICLKEICFN